MKTILASTLAQGAAAVAVACAIAIGFLILGMSLAPAPNMVLMTDSVVTTPNGKYIYFYNTSPNAKKISEYKILNSHKLKKIWEIHVASDYIFSPVGSNYVYAVRRGGKTATFKVMGDGKLIPFAVEWNKNHTWKMPIYPKNGTQK